MSESNRYAAAEALDPEDLDTQCQLMMLSQLDHTEMDRRMFALIEHIMLQEAEEMDIAIMGMEPSDIHIIPHSCYKIHQPDGHGMTTYLDGTPHIFLDDDPRIGLHPGREEALLRFERERVDQSAQEEDQLLLHADSLAQHQVHAAPCPSGPVDLCETCTTRSSDIISNGRADIAEWTEMLRDERVNEIAALEQYIRFGILLHERIHTGGYQTMYTIDDGTNVITRNEYDTRYFDDEKIIGRLFSAVNEGCVTKYCEELLEKYEDDIKQLIPLLDFIKRFGISRNAYVDEVVTLNGLFRKIAESKEMERDDVWQTYKRGLFTGEKMHLRWIDRALAPGDLRYVANIQAKDTASLKELREYIRARTDDQIQRAKERFRNQVIINMPRVMEDRQANQIDYRRRRTDWRADLARRASPRIQNQV